MPCSIVVALSKCPPTFIVAWVTRKHYKFLNLSILLHVLREQTKYIAIQATRKTFIPSASAQQPFQDSPVCHFLCTPEAKQNLNKLSPTLKTCLVKEKVPSAKAISDETTCCSNGMIDLHSLYMSYRCWSRMQASPGGWDYQSWHRLVFSEEVCKFSKFRVI